VFSVLVALLATAESTFALTNEAVLRLDPETRGLVRQLAEDSWFKKEAFASALLGGLIAVGAAWLAHYLQTKKEEDAEKRFNDRVLGAIRVELTTLRQFYDTSEARRFKDFEEGDTFPFWLHLRQNHFTVFESNAAHIGKIEPDLASRLVRVYELLRVLIEYLGVNSRYFEELQQVWRELRIRPTTVRADLIVDDLQRREKQLHAQMAHQAMDLKRLDGQLRSEWDALFKCFEEPSGKP